MCQIEEETICASPRMDCQSRKHMLTIHTPRLRLISGTQHMLHAELHSPQALQQALGAELPRSWPPEFYDEEALRYMLRWLEAHPLEEGWGFYYLVERSRAAVDTVHEAPPLAVGVGGYKGAPDEQGGVEIGYSVVPERRRRGYAREAVDGWLARAFADIRVTRVLAHTLVDLIPSIAVLRSAGFTFNGPGNDPNEPTAVQYVLTRADWMATAATRHPVQVTAE
jgi:RimJ/RimL family protein N-acetyltransferase